MAVAKRYKMDDLDDELFGTLLNSKSHLKSEKASGKSDNSLKKKGTTIQDFDEDDPLAGLLSDHDDDDVDVPVGVHTKADMGTGNKSDSSKDKDSMLRHSPPAMNRRGNILDNLLAKSDVIKSADTSERKSNLNFVLGDQYRSANSKEEDDDLFSFDKNARNNDQMNSYVPKLYNRQPEPKRPATAIGSPDVGDLGSLSTVGGNKLDAPKMRRGRRGISPTVDTPTTQQAEKMPRPHTSVINQPLKSKDWLELKDDQVLAPKATPPPQSLALSDPDENTQRISRRTVDSFVGEVSTTNEGRITAPLGHTGDGLSFTDSDKIEDRQPVVSKQQDGSKESDNFLNWFSNKTKEEKQKTAPSRPSENASSAVPDQQHSQDLKIKIESTQSAPYFNEQASNCRDLSAIVLDYESKLSSMRSQMAELHAKFSEDSLNSATEVLDLKTKVRRLDFERQQLSSVLDGLESRHKEELNAVESSFKKRTQLIEDSYQRREKSLQEELEALLLAQNAKQAAWERERAELVATWKNRVDEAIQDRLNDLEKVKELHRQTITSMKRDHELAITQLRNIKEVEMEAMTEAQSHTKSLQNVIEQLVANTAELGRLQSKVDSGHMTSKEEMVMLLEAKDRQMKMVQEQLQKQREESEQERSTLKEHILRLEGKLHQQTIEVEEARWKLKQEQTRLELDRRAFEESLKVSREKLESERLRLKATKEEFSEEQKMALEKIHAEKSRLLSAAEFGSPQRLAWGFNDIKAQAEYDGALKAINEEKHRLQAHDEHLKIEANRLEAERRAMEREEIELEKTRVEVRDLALQVKRRSEELEEMGMAAAQTREEGFAALQEAEREKSEILKYQEHLKILKDNLETKERNLAEERLNLAKEKKQLEKLRLQLLCVQCQSPIVKDSRPSMNAVNLSNGIYLSAKLLALKIAAEKDMEYLQRESEYLKSLRTPSHANFSVPR